MEEPDNQLLAGSNAIVTGAARGIGSAIARAIAAHGGTVTVVDRSPGVAAVAEELGASMFVGDIADAAFVRDLVQSVPAVDILINNAGEVWPTSPLDDWEKALQDYDRLVGSNLRGAFLFGRAVAPRMAAGGGGHIVNVSSDHVKPSPDSGWHHGHGAMDVYNATKWALNGLTFDWAKSLARHRIRVNNLCLGAADTEMLREWIGVDPDPEYVATWMAPDAIGRVVVELIAEGPTGRTGDNIALWAGQPTVLPPVDQGRLLDS